MKYDHGYESKVGGKALEYKNKINCTIDSIYNFMLLWFSLIKGKALF